MWSSQKISFLLVVFVLTGAAVLLTRWASDKQMLARIHVVAHDGRILSGGQEVFAELLADTQYSGVFYEKHSHQYTMPFPDQLDSVWLLSLQQQSVLAWHDMTPDTLFLRAFLVSYANMIYKIPAAQTDSLNQHLAQNERLRRLAVLAKGDQRDAILARLQAPMDHWTTSQADKLRKRYVNQLLGHISKKALAEPGKSWVVLVDIEHYADLKAKLNGAARFEWVD